MIQRRRFGQTGADSWRTIDPNIGVVMRYTDQSTEPGIAYEYQVLTIGRDIVDVGYWVTGRDVPVSEARKFAYLVVDDTILDAIGPRLSRFTRDLAGDGWNVVQVRATRGGNDAPRAALAKMAPIKNWLAERFAEDPEAKHAVMLIGHIPMIRSGSAAPDGHDQVPHVTDLIYGDIDGKWRISANGELLDNQLPSDFIEMQVGRIDFAPASNGNRALELQLLRAYFDKNHHWRMGLLGDLREAYGSKGHLETEHYDLRNIVGPGAIRLGGHHDVGEQQPWLWGVDFGDWDTAGYAQKYENKAVFAINFGSNKQKIEAQSNGLIALLAQPWFPVAVGWGGRPAWRLHVMGLGGTIGDVHFRTVNNGQATRSYRRSMDYYPTGNYLWRNPIWVNLLGDPSLRAFVLGPPTQVSVSGDTIHWTPSDDPDVLGYQVYRATHGQWYEKLGDQLPVTATGSLDPEPADGARYMVRAIGRKEVHAGSFFTLSQGAFAGSGRVYAIPNHTVLRTLSDKPLPLPAHFNSTSDGVIRSFIVPPQYGALRFEEGGWIYTPQPGYLGEVDIPIAISDALQTTTAKLTIVIEG